MTLPVILSEAKAPLVVARRENSRSFVAPLLRMTVASLLRITVAVGALALTVPFTALHAQDQSARMRAQRDTLERIRHEREMLERRAAELQNTVHDLNEEVTNLDSRAEATARIVATLDAQLASITD
ncbi:MAG TPA: hypothetical protein VF785_01720, partial [Gemmatimonadaceae bacterium]